MVIQISLSLYTTINYWTTITLTETLTLTSNPKLPNFNQLFSGP